MKKLCMIILAAVLLCSFSPIAQAQEYGKIRALQERAAYVTKQKNDFVVRVLSSYKIPHEVNEQGVVVRINMDNKWMTITAIEIVPMLKESPTKAGRLPHTNYFSLRRTGFWTWCRH